MDVHEFIRMNQDTVEPPAKPESAPAVEYTHTPTIREVMSAYVDFHSNAGFETMGPLPAGVPQGPAYARVEFLRFLKTVTPESIEDFEAEIEEQEANQKGDE